jgi:hypothetical protein
MGRSPSSQVCLEWRPKPHKQRDLLAHRVSLSVFATQARCLPNIPEDENSYLRENPKNRHLNKVCVFMKGFPLASSE